MNNTSTTAVKAGLLTVAVFVASALFLANSLKTAPQPQNIYNDVAMQHTAVNQPIETVTVVGTRRAS